MSDKKKLNGETPENDNYREELDELVRIFREELDKALDEAEDEAVDEIQDDVDYEVQGYNPKEVSRDESRKPIVDFDNNCECCGERPRGTRKNPNSTFCEECEAILEKYPYDWKGLVAIIVILGVMIFGAINFAMDVPVFSHMKTGDKFVSEKKYYSAIHEYEMAEINIDEKVRENYKNLYGKRVISGYYALDMDTVNTSLLYLDDKTLDLYFFKDVKAVSDEISAMQATLMIIQQNLKDFEEDDYDDVVATLEALSGKKIYVKNDMFYDELDTDYKPDGTEDVYICDEGWLNVYKYAAAQTSKKDDSVLIGHLEKAIGSNPYIDRVWSTVLASAYVEAGEYDKAVTLAKEIKEMNAEGVDYNWVMSLVYRYRDKDYQKAIDISVAGLNGLAKLDDAYNLVASLGFTLSMQKTLNLVMLGKYTDAYTSAEECCQYQMDAMSTTDSQSRDILAILALATKNTETYDELEKEIKDAGEYAVPFSDDVKNYKEGKITLEEIVMSGRYDIL